LKGKAKRWYEGIHPHINIEGAAREGLVFDKNHPYRTWKVFLESLQTSFGGSLTRDMSVAKWDRLKHKPGQIDQYLDDIVQLMYSIGYQGDAVKDKIRVGLSDELRKEWSKVRNKPDTVAEYISMLRDVGHGLEDDALFQKKLRGSGGNEGESRREKKTQKREKKREVRGKTQSSGGQREAKSSGQSGGFKDRKTELRGISDTVLSERRDARVCLKCGDKDHIWYKCTKDKPVTHSVRVATKKSKKRKRTDTSDGKDEGNADKKAKVEHVAAKPKGFDTPVKSTSVRRPSPPPPAEIWELDSDAASVLSDS
jgi:hypothetical protein